MPRELCGEAPTRVDENKPLRYIRWSPSDFSDFLDEVLPNGGLAVMLSAYFDESSTHKAAPVMSVAGYVFAPPQARKFRREWQKKILEPFGIEYFRMSECVACSGCFKGKSRAECDQAVRQAADIIVRRISAGFVASVSQQEYLSLIPEGWLEKYGSAYTILLQWLLRAIGLWIDKSKSYQGPVAYFFESGDDHQGEANHRLEIAKKKKELAEQYHYSSHTFADKRDMLPLQAADFLAWEWCKFTRETGRGSRAPRKSFSRLILAQQTHHETWHLHSETLKRLIREQRSVISF